VHGVETFGLGAGQRQHAGGHDLQAGPLEARVDLPDRVLGDRIGLDDRKGAFHCHAAGSG
jgi:hypothetical protein